MPRLSCGIWDLVPWLGIELGPSELGAWSLSHWTIREVPQMLIVQAGPLHFLHQVSASLDMFASRFSSHSPVPGGDQHLCFTFLTDRCAQGSPISCYFSVKDLSEIKFPSDTLVPEEPMGLDCSILACPVAHPLGCLGFPRSQLGHLRSEVAPAILQLPSSSLACWLELRAKNVLPWCVSFLVRMVLRSRYSSDQRQTSFLMKLIDT